MGDAKAEEGKKGGGGGGGGEGEKEGGGEEEKKGEAAPPPPPPEEIVMRVYMHCEGCSRKVKRCLQGFEGVEEVKTDCRNYKVVVKGKKAAEDPLKVVERVQKKTGRKVELLTPLPPPKPEKEEEKKEEEKPKPEEKKEEPPVIAVVLKVHMHCEACSQEIKKSILKMKGVQAAEPDLKVSQVTVTGVLDPVKLVEYVYKRTGKHAVVVKQEPVEKKLDEEKKAADGKDGSKDEKKADAGGEKAEGEKKDEREGGGEEKEKEGGGGAAEHAAAGGAAKVVDLMKNEFCYYYPRYGVGYAYPPQIFSDENPNACTVM
ncbi:heavy metal-associated isoprenylated plant protein 7-like isoform X2 [Phoenix dactylifera]|nr:heavy metal-associated isoprenylated plant protein 7-like isoform X2 [Phoenix dactylifera]